MMEIPTWNDGKKEESFKRMCAEFFLQVSVGIKGQNSENMEFDQGTVRLYYELESGG